jgi:glycosyltransferase involved in cell wall biosynthesis
MNLLYVLTTYPPSTGGAQIHQHMLAQQMLTHHQVQVLSLWDSNRTDWLLGTTLRMPQQSRDYVIDGVKVHRLGLSSQDKLRIAPFLPLYYPLMDVALPPIAARYEEQIQPYAEKADLIHNVRIGREGLSVAALQAARKQGIPFVLTPVHHPRWVGWRYRAYNRLYQLADAVFTLTRTEKQTLIELGVREDRITVIGHGPTLAETAHPEEFVAEQHIDGPMILFVGQHFAYKGYKQLLDAAPLVWAKVPATHFVFIGPAVNKSEDDFAAMPDRRIHRLGSVSLQEKTDALAACTVYCMPSTQESFGGVYTEAWTFGKPVIGCNIPAVTEVISNGENGYLVQQDSREIADKIIDLLLHPAIADAMGTAGKHKVTECYSWSQISKSAEEAYMRTLGNRR